jgi:hypothetical protein
MVGRKPTDRVSGMAAPNIGRRQPGYRIGAIISRSIPSETATSGRPSRVSRGCDGVPSRTLCPPRAAALPPARGRSSRRDPWRWKGRRASSWCWASNRPAWPHVRKRGTPSARPPRRTSAAARMARNPHRQIRRPAPRLSSPFCRCASPNIARCDLSITTAFAPIAVSAIFLTMTSRFVLTQVPAYVIFIINRCSGESTAGKENKQGRQRR